MKFSFFMSHGLMSREFMANQFPRGIYEQVETGLHPSWVTTPLCCLIYCHSLYTYAVTGYSYCPNTYTHTQCISLRGFKIPCCTCLLHSKLILWQKNV